MDADRTQKRIEELKAKLAARTGMKGYAKNCAAIEAEIARLEAACPDCGASPSQS